MYSEPGSSCVCAVLGAQGPLAPPRSGWPPPRPPYCLLRPGARLQPEYAPNYIRPILHCSQTPPVMKSQLFDLYDLTQTRLKRNLATEAGKIVIATVSSDLSG
eukprot:6180569-Pleurochrysis_carterae.AAC.1